jgi:hypothetical protein
MDGGRHVTLDRATELLLGDLHEAVEQSFPGLRR